MKTTIKSIAIILGIMSLTSCAFFTENWGANLNTVHSGMTKQEVIDLLGTPPFRSFDANSETLTYNRFANYERTLYEMINIIVVNDTVVSMKTDFVPNPQRPVIKDEKKR